MSASTLRLRWELRTLVGRSPWLARRLVTRSGELVTGDSEIVIDGFPRCGNTFAVTAFLSAQPRPVSVAHHVHAPAQILDAVRLRIPAIVLIREARECVPSMLVRYPHLTLAQGVRGYLRFYEPLLPIRSAFVTAPFDRLLTDFGGVIREVNQRFGTSFGEFEHTEEQLRKVSEEVDTWDRGAFAGDPGGFRLNRAQPSEERDRRKEPLRLAYDGPAMARHRTRAESLYRRFTER